MNPTLGADSHLVMQLGLGGRERRRLTAVDVLDLRANLDVQFANTAGDLLNPLIATMKPSCLLDKVLTVGSPVEGLDRPVFQFTLLAAP